MNNNYFKLDNSGISSGWCQFAMPVMQVIMGLMFFCYSTILFVIIGIVWIIAAFCSFYFGGYAIVITLILNGSSLILLSVMMPHPIIMTLLMCFMNLFALVYVVMTYIRTRTIPDNTSDLPKFKGERLLEQSKNSIESESGIDLVKVPLYSIR